MNKYVIKKIDYKDYKYLVIGLDISSLDEYIFEVEKDLRNKCGGKSAMILFDLLLCNGLNNRFFKIRFDGEKLNIQKIEYIEKMDKEVRNVTFDYIKNNSISLEKSALTKAQKFLYKKGHYLKTKITVNA